MHYKIIKVEIVGYPDSVQNGKGITYRRKRINYRVLDDKAEGLGGFLNWQLQDLFLLLVAFTEFGSLVIGKSKNPLNKNAFEGIEKRYCIRGDIFLMLDELVGRGFLVKKYYDGNINAFPVFYFTGKGLYPDDKRCLAVKHIETKTRAIFDPEDEEKE